MDKFGDRRQSKEFRQNILAMTLNGQAFGFDYFSVDIKEPSLLRYQTPPWISTKVLKLVGYVGILTDVERLFSFIVKVGSVAML